MAVGVDVAPQSEDRQWYIVGRWQEYEGEARANLLRIIAIAAFYSIELANYYGFKLGFLEMEHVEHLTKPFHQAVTALSVAWTMTGLGILLCLRLHIFPAPLKFLSTGFDIGILTAILAVGEGPKSPVIVGYFLIIALASLRLNLPLVWFATLGSMSGYLILLGHAKWFAARDVRVPRYHQLMFLLALALMGVILGQVIRRVRWMAEDYAKRIGSKPT
jgi:hypothetical protein